MPTAPSEFQIQRAVCIWLDKPGVLHPDVVYWHTPNGGSRDAREGARFKQIGVKPGIPDLLFLHRGRLFGLELKDEKGRQSAAQMDMQRRFVLAGAEYAVVNSLAAARGQIAAWNLTRC